MDYTTENYLAHHGIKGQKWGIRRFQNADGSYTEAGKKRYGIDTNSERKQIDSRKVKKIVRNTLVTAGVVSVAAASIYVGKKAYSIRKEDALKTISEIKSLSDDALNLQLDRVKREHELLSKSNAILSESVNKIKQEKELKRLNDEMFHPGREYLKNLAKSVGNRSLSTIGAGAVLYGAKTLISGKYDTDELANAIFNGGPKKK